MKFKVDENLPVEVAQMLLAAGHDVMTVLDQALGGAPDPDLAKVCCVEERALLTLDLDFSNIQAYPPRDYPGIIVLRLTQQDKAHVLHTIAAAIPLLLQEPLSGRLWIIDEHRIRIRE
ncbi:MAG: DUF5615 family PIN-like protein [Holophagaceae bacterium]|nr:DUF5615 family PIN-like protein [Holophagaceae bacterium]